MEEHEGARVAWLEVWETNAGRDGESNALERIEIHANEEFYLGRDPKICRRYWPHPMISSKHLRFQCIVYDEDTTLDVPPLIYVQNLSRNGTSFRSVRDRFVDVEGSSGRLRGNNSEAMLLNDGDELWIKPFLYIKYHTLARQDDWVVTDPLQEREQRCFSDDYFITNQKIGVGGHGCVYAAIHRKTRQQLACKVIDIRSLRSRPDFRTSDAAGHRTEQPRKRDNYKAILDQFREFSVLKDLCHANIIQLEKVFWSCNTIYIFQELVSGGDLFSYIDSKSRHISDTDAALIVRQILKGVEYLHDHDIVHRDLKPDNILMTSYKAGARVVLTDFGHARYLAASNTTSPRKRRMVSRVGTYEYAAPEVHGKNPTIPAGEGYSKAVDMWSIGCITCALLSGDVIFVDRTDPLYYKHPEEVVFNLAAQCDLSVMDHSEKWKKVGKRPKDFIRGLLVLDEVQRMTVKEALQHSWFTHKFYAAEFEAVYKLAMKDWKPRRKAFKLVESLNLGMNTPWEGQHDSGPVGKTTASRYFSQPPAPFTNPFYPTVRKAPTNKRKHTPLPTIAEEEECTEHAETPQSSRTDVASEIPLPLNVASHAVRNNGVPLSLTQLDISNELEEGRHNIEDTERTESLLEADYPDDIESCISDSFPQSQICPAAAVPHDERPDVVTEVPESTSRERQHSFDFDDFITYPTQSGVRSYRGHDSSPTENPDTLQTKRMKVR